MTIEEVENHFDNLNQACIALKIAPQNMTLWKSKGYIPWKQQFKLFLITNGELIPDAEDPALTYKRKT